MNYTNRPRETPTKSPFAKSPNPRSPTKTTRQELGLSLQQVIGTTCGSANCFDTHSQSSSFAYTAGAAAVVATVDKDLQIKQRFFRAHASQYAVNKSSNSSNSLQPASADLRSRFGNRSSREDSPFSPGPPDVTDSPSGKAGGHAKDRVKAATAVILSKDGKWLAVGETGYRPRVLVFPITGRTSTDVPAAIVSEHSFGVQAVAFSPDSKLLATLGTVNDGFLYIWEIDDKSGAATLLASNKCTNIVKSIAWMGRSLITVGTRFVKIWRPDDPSPVCTTPGEQTNTLSGPSHKPLAGRNSLLNALIDETFVSVTPLSDDSAILCTESGHVCMLDDSEKQQRLHLLLKLSKSITAAASTASDGLLVACHDGEMKFIPIDDLKRVDIPTPDAVPASPRPSYSLKKNHPVALGLLPVAVVTVDSNHRIELRIPPSTSTSQEKAPFSLLTTLAAHYDPVLGVRSVSLQNQPAAKFLTWSAGGTIMGWTGDGRSCFGLTARLDQINDMYDVTNELRTVSLLPRFSLLATGDRYGVIRVIRTSDGSELHTARAHSSDITDIAIREDGANTYLATSSRDRSIQVFKWQADGLDLQQTLDEHAGAVTGVLFAGASRHLLSCSADRTIVVRQALDTDDGSTVFVISRTITLRSSPTSMRLSKYENTVLVSTSDRSVHLINFDSGRVTHTFKAADAEGGDPVTLASFIHIPSATGTPIIAGVSSTDKSVRLYSEDGTLLARDTGHTEGVTDIALIDTSSSEEGTTSSAKIVTVAADGTVFIWHTAPPARTQHTIPELSTNIISPTNPSSPIARPPLRKVISSAEIVRLQRAKSPEHEDGEPTTPSVLRSPPVGILRKKPSRLNVSHAPRLEPRSPHGEASDPFTSPQSRRSPSPSRSPTRTPHSANSRTKKSPPRKSHINSLDGIVDSPAPATEKSKASEKASASNSLCRSLDGYKTALMKQGNDLAAQDVKTIETNLEEMLKFVKGLQSQSSWVAQDKPQNGLEQILEDLSTVSVSLHSRLGDLRKNSSEVVPGAEQLS